MRRVSVVGGSCSGKTTLGRTLAAMLDVPFVELDALNWRENWTMTDIDVFQRSVREATAGDAWVVDGNYGGRGAREIVWSRADTVVWLDLPLLVTLRRMWTRTSDRIRRRRPLWAGNQETIRNTFFSRDSLFVWAVTTHRRRRRVLAELIGRPEYAHLDLHRLRTPAEVERWLAQRAAARGRVPV